jgi:hypothetical protein
MNCARRDVFLLIEPVVDYSPLAPVLCARRYGRDCQFNEGHEFGRIPADEILQPTLDSPPQNQDRRRPGEGARPSALLRLRIS